MDEAASSLALHVPRLRRFARALTGEQRSGDAYVAATLQALVADPSCMPAALSTRAGLFHVFLRVWNSLELNQVADRVPATTAVDRRLSAVTPLPRQAFLLFAMEDFGIADVAHILDVDEAAARDLLDEAARQINEQVVTDVLIIEDEPLIAMDLSDIVTALEHRLIGVARTRSEAARLIQSRRPGLVLADIQLADGSSGLDAVNDLLGALSVPVIFITAFPERLLTGERPEPTYLIAKPFQETTLKAVISQALFFERQAMRRAG